MPCRLQRPTIASIIGWLANGSMGLGQFDVSGRRRVPSPPAMITAFMGPNLPWVRFDQNHETSTEASAGPAWAAFAARAALPSRSAAMPIGTYNAHAM